MDDKKEFTVASETWTYLNNVLISHKKETSTQPLKWIEPKDDPVYQSMKKNISIGALHPIYIETSDIQDKDYEESKINKFLIKYLEKYSKEHNIPQDNLKIKFINYGKTELVYVLTEKESGNRITLLVKQPAVELGKVKQEAENLLELKKIDDMVVAPIDYFRYGDQELYATPYINQARCVASDGSWGMYIPEPYYRFEPFTDEQEKIVNRCMIAKLVSLYDVDKSEGISSCKLGGGDFMLPKGWENEQPTIKNTLTNLYLIAAREKINCSFQDYLDIIKQEFSRSTIRENQDELKINLRGRVPMQPEDIEKGISLGKRLLINRLYPEYQSESEM